MVAAPTSGRHIVGVEFTRERMGERHETFAGIGQAGHDD
jgi:hypothetical protein